ncbi:MAG: ParA family protein [Chloroflexi bacterium]|nr:ParA family protein [Chloroflexota bacterium]
MRIIAVTNQKGGTTKTTTTVNLGAALAQAGQQVLVVDADPQADASIWLRQVDKGHAISPSLYEVLTADDLPLADIVRPTTTSNLSIAPCDLRLASAELHLLGEMGGELHLRRAMTGLERFDYVLVDCAPSLGLIVVNVLCVAPEIIIPLQAEYLPMDALVALGETVAKIRQLFNPALRVMGVLVGRFSPTSDVRRDSLDAIQARFGDLMFETIIGQDVRLEEAPAHRLTILEHAPATRSARQFLALAQEVMSRGQ